MTMRRSDYYLFTLALAAALALGWCWSSIGRWLHQVLVGSGV